MSTDIPNGTLTVPRSKVFPWPMQPRKHFDLEYLNELAGSIEKHGILNDLICRPRPGSVDEFEIIGGECRWRSAEIAGRDEVPIKVREMNDGDALELALVDNMKRKDLTEMEECDAFHQALEQRDEGGLPRYSSIDDFAVKIGVSAGYVRQRLSLRKLPKEGRAAMDRGDLSFRVARVVCGCPAPIVEEVLAHVLNPERYSVWLPGIGFVHEPLNAEKTQLLIEEKFVRKLAQAPFPLEDEKLLPVHRNDGGERLEGGACSDCPWNSTNRDDGGEARGGGKARAHTNCLNPACFARKVEIHTALALVKAKEEGCTILQGKEAEKILQGSPSGTLSYSYVDLDEKVPPEERAKGVTDRKAPTWGKVVFGTASAKVVTGRNEEGEATSERVSGEMGVPVIVAVDSRGKVHRLVERKIAVAAAAKTESAPLLNLSAGRAKSLQEDDAKKQQQKQREEAKLRNEVTFAAVDEVVKAVAVEHMSKKDFVAEFWAWMIGIAAWHGGSDAAHFVTKRLGLEGRDQYDAVEKHAKTLVTMGARRAFAIELLIGRLVKFSGVDDKHFRALCKLYKVDIGAIEKRIKEAKKKGPALPKSGRAEISKLIAKEIKARKIGFAAFNEMVEARFSKSYVAIQSDEEMNGVLSMVRELVPVAKKKTARCGGKEAGEEASAQQFPGEVNGVLMPFVWYGDRLLFLEGFDGFHVTLEDPKLPRRTSAVCILEHQARDLKAPTESEVVDYSAEHGFDLPARYVERCDDTLISHFLDTVRTPAEKSDTASTPSEPISPENYVFFAKLDAMKEAGEKISPVKVQSKFKLPGLKSAGLLITAWEKRRAAQASPPAKTDGAKPPKAKKAPKKGLSAEGRASLLHLARPPARKKPGLTAEDRAKIASKQRARWAKKGATK